MISDEMRELLSAYVDGELRDADAARVEDVSKRDPELRKEIEAYRMLRRKLREWDEAEHGAAPSPAFMTRALARARTVDTALAVPARSASWRPLAMAAGLLLAVGAGYGLARSTAPGAPSLPPSGTPLVLKALEAPPDLSLEGSALAPANKARPEVVHRMRIDDHMPSRRAVELEELMRGEELLVAKPREPEVRTGPPLSAEISAMFAGYMPAARQMSEALVVISRPPALSAIEPVDAATGRALDPSAGIIMPKLYGKGNGVIAPLGELWVGVDGKGHTRVVAGSNWLERNVSAPVPVVWADDVGKQKTTPDVEVQEFILGPSARRRLLQAKPGLDAAFLAWLRENYGAKPLTEMLADADAARDRERSVNKLVDVLTRDRAATGFAVFDAKGKLLGTELFQDHATMLTFAPRLLRGYLFEAGEDGIRVAEPRAGSPGHDAVRDLLGGMPGRGLRIERERLDVLFNDELGKATETMRAPAGVARVTLFSSSGHPVGHGLVRDDTPIHLTLFGE